MNKKATSPLPAGVCDPRALAGLPADAPLAVALSGGADSVALLAMLAPLGHLIALHVHHGIRGEEADRDALFCRKLTQRLDVPLEVLHIDAPALARERKVGIETAARDGRYAAMTAYLQQHGIPLLVTAHHADDQLETMLQNLLRGAGLCGLCGIPACRPLAEGVLVARPLLSLTRKDLKDYLQKADLPFVTDSTNQEPCCNRNRLRLEVVPALEAIAPHAASSAARCAATLAEDEAYLEQLADDFVREQGSSPRLDALAALPRPIFARVMRRLLPILPEQVHLAALWQFCATAKPHASLSLPHCTVRESAGRLTLGDRHAPPVQDYHLYLHEGENEIPEINGVAILARSGDNSLPPPKNFYKYSTCVNFSSAIINGRLALRPRRAGDKILSCGMHKVVRRLPGLSQLPPDVRARMPLLVDDGGVLAVPFAVCRDGAAKEADTTLFLYFN